MSVLAGLVFLFLTGVAEARIDARFLSVVGMVAVTDRVMGQVTDDDPQRLHALMRGESKGKGNIIRLPGKKFSLLCSERNPGEMLCSMVVKSGPQGTVSPGNGIIRFVSLGEEAKHLHSLFAADPESGRMEYRSVDGSLRLYSDGESFVAEYKRGG